MTPPNEGVNLTARFARRRLRLEALAIVLHSFDDSGRFTPLGSGPRHDRKRIRPRCKPQRRCSTREGFQPKGAISIRPL
jgi:hypothetical protein